MNPNQMNPNMMSNQMNSNQMNSNMMNPNMMNSNTMDPNQMNPNQMNPNMMNPNQMNPNMNVYRPQSNGTLLADLMKDNEKEHSTPHIVRQDYEQQPIRNNQGSNGEISRSNGRSNGRGNRSSIYTESDRESEYDGIRELANDVNHSLRALEKIETIKKKKIKKDTEVDDTEESEDDKESIDDKEDLDEVTVKAVEVIDINYGKMFTEFLILLTLYVVMSQPFVVSIASYYIHQLNPSEDGSIDMTGLIIYGLIMTVMFMVIRKLIFSKF